jgi:hypothetical protein
MPPPSFLSVLFSHIIFFSVFGLILPRWPQMQSKAHQVYIEAPSGIADGIFAPSSQQNDLEIFSGQMHTVATKSKPPASRDELGIGFQTPILSIQALLPLADVPVSAAIVIFSQSLGGSLFISIEQTIFQG